MGKKKNDVDILDQIGKKIISRENRARKKLYDFMVTDLVLKKWENVGLLEGIKDETSRRILSLLFEALLNSIMTNDRDDAIHETTCFPILRRIFSVGKLKSLFHKNQSMGMIMEKAQPFVNSLNRNILQYLKLPSTVEKMKNYSAFNGIDAELEIVCEYSENFQLSWLDYEMKKPRKVK